MDSLNIFPPLRRIILESPLVQEIVEEAVRADRVQYLIHLLERRFGAVPPSIATDLEKLESADLLLRLIPLLVDCDSLQSFTVGMRDDLLRSTPSKRRTKRSASRRP